MAARPHDSSIRHAHIWSRIADRLRQYALLVRLHRPIGIYLLLWPALWALWIAGEGRPDPLVLAVFVAGVVVTRSAGCAINDYADRHVDLHVERTRNRPLALGTVSAREALAVFAGLSLLAFALVLLLNWATVALSLVAIVLAASYPFMKRYHHLPQVHLGAAFGWAIPMAFTAQTGAWPPSVAWLLFAANLLWTTAYDTEYAMADREDDLALGVKSTAILFGTHDRLAVALLQVGALVLLAGVGLLAGLGGTYYLGLSAAAAIAAYQHYLIRGRDPQAAFHAFLNNAWLGGAVFAGLVLDYIYH